MIRELSDVKCLAIIPKREDTHITCCDLNIRMEHNSRTEDCFDKYVTSFVSKAKTVHGWLINNNMKIDIHGGHTDECYFGYINPSIVENKQKVRARTLASASESKTPRTLAVGVCQAIELGWNISY